MERSRLSLLLALFCCLLIACSKRSRSQSDFWEASHTLKTEGGIVVELGPREVLLRDGALGLRYFPDEAIVLLDREPRLKLLITAGPSTYLVEGRDLHNLDRVTLVLSPGAAGSFDNGYAGISGAYRHVDGGIYGFYHAEDHEDLPNQPGGLYPGVYASIATAVSFDAGYTWTKLGPSITSWKPKAWSAFEGQSDRGVATPSMVLDRTGAYLLAFYTDHSRIDGRGVPICLARAEVSRDPPVPGRWKKYHDGQFDEPGLSGRDTPILSVGSPDETAALQPHVVFSAQLDRYIMVLNVAWWRESLGDAELTRSGIYIAFSDDGIQWSTPEPLIIDHSLPAIGKSLSWEATILWDKDSTAAGWLVYGYAERWGPAYPFTPHYMVARRIRFRPNPQELESS